MIKQYQVTLICNDNKYKPVSSIVNFEQESEADLSYSTISKKKIIDQGIIKICQKRYWDKKDLARYGYTKVKIRLYDKEKIAAAAEETYAKIKAEKYACGEWKAPKRKTI